MYFEPKCSSTKHHHAVLVVGYGYHRGTPYWLVKNRCLYRQHYKISLCIKIILVLPLHMAQLGPKMGNGWLHHDVSKLGQSMRHCHQCCLPHHTPFAQISWLMNMMMDACMIINNLLIPDETCLRNMKCFSQFF